MDDDQPQVLSCAETTATLKISFLIVWMPNQEASRAATASRMWLASWFQGQTEVSHSLARQLKAFCGGMRW